MRVFGLVFPGHGDRMLTCFFFFSEERIGRWFDVYAGLSLDDAKITIRSVAAFQQFIDSSSMLYGRSPLIRSKKMHYPYDSRN